eukprot:SAG11_NODE_3009_length_2769_cov_1.646816_1_plen_61_part_00
MIMVIICILYMKNRCTRVPGAGTLIAFNIQVISAARARPHLYNLYCMISRINNYQYITCQ